MDFKDTYGVLQITVSPSIYSGSIVAGLCCFASALWHRVKPNPAINHQRVENKAEIDPVFNMKDPYEMIYAELWEASLGLENIEADL